MKTYINKEQPITESGEEIYQVRCVETEAVVGYCLNSFEEFPDTLDGAVCAAGEDCAFKLV